MPTSKRAATLDLSRILNNPYAKEKKGMIFNPKKVFDFELNKTLDERVLVKELLPSLEKKQKRILELDVKIQTVHSAQSSVLRLQDVIRTDWKKTAMC